MLHSVSRGAQTVRILSDETDVFLLLVYWCYRANVTYPIQMEKWDGTVLDINDTVSRLGSTCSRILGMRYRVIHEWEGQSICAESSKPEQRHWTGLSTVWER